MKIYITIFIAVLAVVLIVNIFNLGISVGKAQIVKEALSKLPHGKIDIHKIQKGNIENLISDFKHIK